MNIYIIVSVVFPFFLVPILCTAQDTVSVNLIDEKGLKQGTWVEYYGNDNLKNKTSYINDTIDGTYTSYYENGILKAKIIFKMGIKLEQTSFYNNSQKQFYVLCNFKGETLYMCKYDEQGQIRMQTMYFEDKGKKNEYEIHISKDGKVISEGGVWH